jgi:catechol 2,3-dioxygenase
MGELPAETRLGSIRLRAADAGLLRDFYQRVIGLRPLVADGSVTSFGAGDRPLVELVAAPDAPSRPPQTTGLFHLAVLVPSRADLAVALRRIWEAGWHLSGASDHLVSEALYLSDPEGNGIELYRDRPRNEWRRVGDELEMATLPLDLEDLLAEPEPRAGSDEATMPQGTVLGHVHLQVADLAPAQAFWVDALGLDVTVRSYPGALFVSAGGYHHHVGLNTWAGVGVPRPPEGARGLDRFEVLVPDQGTVDAVRTRLAAVAEARDVDGGVLAEDPSGNVVLVRAEAAV